MVEPTETDDLSSEDLMDSVPTIRKPTWDTPDLGPLHVCDNAVAWSLSEISNSRSVMIVLSL